MKNNKGVIGNTKNIPIMITRCRRPAARQIRENSRQAPRRGLLQLYKVGMAYNSWGINMGGKEGGSSRQALLRQKFFYNRVQLVYMKRFFYEGICQ